MNGIPLFDKANEEDYLQNKNKFNNFQGKFPSDTMNECFEDDPSKRPSFDFIQKEFVFYYIDELASQKTDAADQIAIETLGIFGSDYILNTPERSEGTTNLMSACYHGRIRIVEALLEKGADLTSKKYGMTALTIAKQMEED